MNGAAHDGPTNSNINGLPGVAVRGGYWAYGSGAGAFTLSLERAPTRCSAYVGARCCRGR